MEDFIEIGITHVGEGKVNLHSYDKRFCAEFGGFVVIPIALLYSKMLDLARWVDNDADPHNAVSCYFYMD